MLTEQKRAYIYRILIAIGTVATGYGLITADQVALWLGLATAILNVMPAANTSTQKDNK